MLNLERYIERVRRKTLKYIDVPLPAEVLQGLRVTFAADPFQLRLDGKVSIEPQHTPIAGSATVGVCCAPTLPWRTAPWIISKGD